MKNILKTKEDKRIFFDAIINPPKPNEKLKEAFKKYNKEKCLFFNQKASDTLLLNDKRVRKLFLEQFKKDFLAFFTDDYEDQISVEEWINTEIELCKNK